ncbi:MAG: acetate--CoA ligase family protein [Sandaracinaceae bacterium]|nr:acetate--CoA ligase family protein [Sandaracinaceae bacterium]
MTRAAWISCDDAQLAVECATIAASLGIPVEPRIDDAPLAHAAAAHDGPLAVALATPPTPEALVRLAAGRPAGAPPLALAVVASTDAARRARVLASDLGLATVDEVEPLLAVLALLAAGAEAPWTASVRGLSALDRARLGPMEAGRTGGRFEPADDGRLAWRGRPRSDAAVIGRPAPVGAAVEALRLRTLAAPRARATVDGVDRRAVHDVLFGPPRALSDPASKSALAPYGLPLPLEELCGSPSRAAAEASRIGFPVRISLASPDLRIWDHPDLAVDGVDNAARVRDVYRQVMVLASERQPDARLLGVHVTATTAALAVLRVVAEPLPEGYVLTEIGFADPHGEASRDRTSTVLPAGPDAIERVLSRLAAADLLLAGTPAQRKSAVGGIADVLLRVAAFVCDHAEEVERVEIHPLAVLIGGGIEAREACVTVGDAFLRTLRAPARRAGATGG